MWRVLVLASLALLVSGQEMPDYGYPDYEGNGTAKSTLPSSDATLPDASSVSDFFDSLNGDLSSSSSLDSDVSDPSDYYGDEPDYNTSTLRRRPPSSYCDCSCKAISSSTGQDATTEELLKQDATLSCSTCCDAQQLVQEMKPFLPKVDRVTKKGKACNKPRGLLSIFLQPICWSVEEEECTFPFIYGFNQVVVNCTTAGGQRPWCVYDMDKWNSEGEGWGYCKKLTAADVASSESEVVAMPDKSGNNASEVEESNFLEDSPFSDNVTSVDQILANLTESQQQSLENNDQFAGIVSSVTHSGGLTTAGIAAIVVVCIVVVGALVGGGFMIYRCRDRIKLRRESKFQNMDQEPAEPGAYNGGEVAMAKI